MGFGQTLREAREAKGYTVEQLAEATHIMSRTIKGLEAEDFSSIVAPIYGRGFVKICCQTLGIDPKPMVDEFMAIYNGEKPPAASPVAVETVTPAPPPEPDPVAPPAVEDAPVAEEPPVAAEPPAKAPLGDLFNQPSEPPAAKPPVSRFAPPQPQGDDRIGSPSMPAIPWRLVVLIVIAAVALWGVFAGCRALYRALGSADEGTGAAAPAVTVEPPKTDGVTAPAAARTPKPVKPLYID